LLLIGVGSLGPEPLVRSAVSGSEFVRAVAERRASLVDFYLSEHFDPNAQVAQDRSLLLAAALEQDWATARKLLDAGASVDLADENKLTPLMVAAMQGKIDMVREFVGRAMNLEATDRLGRSALHYAIASRRIEMVNLLLSVMPVLDPAAAARSMQRSMPAMKKSSGRSRSGSPRCRTGRARRGARLTSHSPTATEIWCGCC
jgi:FOG: Ankyrin repeat